MDLLEHGLRPHLILIDLLLPRISGFDVLHHIHTDPALRAIPRIVITGAAERGVIVADAIFEKPFDHIELIAAIHRLVGTDESKARSDAARPSSRDVAHDAPPPGRRRARRRRS